MTKLELLGCIDYCLKNECALVLNAGDYFTDYLKIVSSHTMKNFQTEVKKYGTHDEEFNRVVIHRSKPQKAPYQHYELLLD